MLWKNENKRFGYNSAGVAITGNYEFKLLLGVFLIEVIFIHIGS